MGRISEYPQHLPAPAWHERMSANIGGGMYRRDMVQPSGARVYRVSKLCTDGEFPTITQALAQWSADKQGAAPPLAAIIDIADSGTYHEAPQIRLEEGEHLQIRAASMARPVLRMFDYCNGTQEQIRIAGAPGSRLVLDGLLVAGGGIEIDDAGGAPVPASVQQERFLVTLRHSTLVPGWETDSDSPAPWRGKASVLLRAAGVVFRVDHSVVGPIQVAGAGSLLALHVGDSVVDGGHAQALAITDAGYGPAPVRASFVRAIVIGLAQVEEIALADDSVFLGPLLTVRRNAGRVRRCHLAPGSRTPARDDCEPAAVPRYVSLEYGTPGYARLVPDCGADLHDDAGMGDLYDLPAPPAVRAAMAAGLSA